MYHLATSRIHHSYIYQACIWLVCGLLAFQTQAHETNGLPNFSQVVEKVGDSVVNIVTIKHQGKALIPDELRDDIEETPLMDVLEEMFGETLDERLSGKTPGLGSGSVVSKDGYIITNMHVIEGADEIYVRLNDQREFLANVIGTDQGTDLALLKIQANDLKPLVYASTEDIKVGEWVLAIGSPYGFEHTVTVGVISATGRSLGVERYVPFIQTDVAINPGNSGGGLFNLHGELVGINSQIISESGSYAGLSFAVPSQVVQSVIQQLKTTGTVARGWMGLAFQDLTRDLAASFGMNKVRGALVAKVIPGSPAERAGVQLGDVIISFHGKEVVRATDLPPIVGLIPIDTDVKLTVIRQRKVQELTLQIQSYAPKMIQSHFAHEGVIQSAITTGVEQGVLVRNLEDYEKRILEPGQQGVMVVKVVNPSWMDAGIRRGDVILSMNHQNVADKESFYQILLNAKQIILPILVTRAGEIQRFVSVKK